ncbi:type II toxin-antitoxin system prevent-host-death family antitoxin [[Haemophilus] felis]|uniref:Antitoxin n=1 Tax=[Haemophilus] felis TaxID=123822 RepID=A0A1T0AZX0_9PAST|nr:type II toxin-antitoxin system prevent-host-death family antitoxin [[Haemophilus] felis]NBI40129.1 type II toxin-antitoxin system prevent-host-death family antitoxin [[Haemophilus] felis]NBI42682.1 type II toxin-antitoxin system prevent-host-death family antitoxin [[Haemophilus] felis]OOS03503.1 prevent-host-death protein [[Haemophilus] felis]
MTIMTSREFNQRLGDAQKAAQIAPVIITNRGEPSYVLMSYSEYAAYKKPFLSVADAFADPDPMAADIELELQPRSRGQRRPVDLED